MLSLFLQILDNIPVPPKLRNQAKLENSNQTTPFLQWRFRTKPSHPSDSTNVRCEKLFLQLWGAMIPTPSIDTYNGHTHSTKNFKVGYTTTLLKRPISAGQIIKYFGLQMQNTMGLLAQ